MLKKISAALLVASMFTVPALAETAVKTQTAPVTKSETAPAAKTSEAKTSDIKTSAAPAAKSDAMKPSVSNAKAQSTDTKAVKKVTPHHRHRMHVSGRSSVKRVAHKPAAKVSAVKPSTKQIKNKV